MAQVGDDRYSLAGGPNGSAAAAHPLAAGAGPVISGDPDARFAGLVAILVDARPGCGQRAGDAG